MPPQARSLRHLRALHRRLPDAGDRRALPARRAALHLLPHDRATRARFPEELRPLIGNRVYGCDDCQLVCPWNGFAQALERKTISRCATASTAPALVELFAWTEAEFDERLRGSPIRRIGYERWLRNLAVGLGNAPTSPEVIVALRARADHPSALVREHVQLGAWRAMAWQPDRLLPGYEALELPAPDDYDGPRRGDAGAAARRRDAPRGAVLYVHGFIDYFFQRHMAERFAAEGYAFYALDLRKHGRSLLPHQHPCFCKDIAEYHADITRALEEIGARRAARRAFDRRACLLAVRTKASGADRCARCG